jgi:hypothetical protein
VLPTGRPANTGQGPAQPGPVNVRMPQRAGVPPGPAAGLVARTVLQNAGGSQQPPQSGQPERISITPQAYTQPHDVPEPRSVPWYLKSGVAVAVALVVLAGYLLLTGMKEHRVDSNGKPAVGVIEEVTEETTKRRRGGTTVDYTGEVSFMTDEGKLIVTTMDLSKEAFRDWERTEDGEINVVYNAKDPTEVVHALDRSDGGPMKMGFSVLSVLFGLGLGFILFRAWRPYGFRWN